MAKLFGCSETDVDKVVRDDAAARRELTRRGFLGAALALAASPVAPAPENLIQVARTPEIWTEQSLVLSNFWLAPTEKFIVKFFEAYQFQKDIHVNLGWWE